MESPICAGESSIETAKMYQMYQKAAVAEFDAYRVDLDILAVCSHEKIILLSDGEPRALFDRQILDPANPTYQRFLSTVKKNNLFDWQRRWEPDHVLGFMRHSLKDRLSEEVKAEMTGRLVHYVAIRKERGDDGVRKRMWFDSYSPIDANNWQHNSGILNIDNCPFKPAQVNILHNKQYVYRPRFMAEVREKDDADNQ